MNTSDTKKPMSELLQFKSVKDTKIDKHFNN